MVLLLSAELRCSSRRHSRATKSVLALRRHSSPWSWSWSWSSSSWERKSQSNSTPSLPSCDVLAEML